MSPIPSQEHLLFMLRANNLNWFAFVTELAMLLRNHTESVLTQALCDFSHQLSFLDLSADEEQRIERSRQAYLAREREKTAQDTLSDDESDSANQWFNGDLTEQVLKKRKKFKRKHARLKAQKIAEARLLRKKLPKGVSRILKRFPNIGKDVEEFVKSRKVGADAWRRTGVLTFDGNVKQGPKVTYRSIQQHLQTKYGTKISYGTTVQLSVIRNKRRLSAKGYRGVARITCRRARKGFTIKMNPDAHWNTAMYRSLDYLQLKNGTEQVVLNRDDAAGFRLDTTFTHKQHKGIQLLDSQDLTTRTDYVNKYQSLLQTTSYMFLPTSSTPASCIGVVKPHVLYDKNPCQHMADLNMLGKQDENAALFKRMSDGKPKDMWFVRVDGASDEGPPHKEVQFLWTEKHTQEGHAFTAVTTRHSGGSYLNPVELMNGCLAVAHSNCFIPSTLGGPVNSENGIDTEQLKHNLDLATDVYISRVDGASCGDTKIKLCKGDRSDSAEELLKRRPKLLSFLNGKPAEKKMLLEKEPDLYDYFTKVWDVYNRHMLSSVPKQYVLVLKPCFKTDCLHPLCNAAEPSVIERTWFPGGPAISYFPLPVPDVTRAWGADCSACVGFCGGHYLEPENAWKCVQEKGMGVCQTKPPSVVLQSVFNSSEKKGEDLLKNENALNDIAKEVLLTPNDVKMWIEHLKGIKSRRQQGARKAAATRATKKGTHER